MTSIIALLLTLQVGYSDAPATQPTAQATAQSVAPDDYRYQYQSTNYPNWSIDRVSAIPPVYPENYATRYLGLPAAPYSQSRFHIPPAYYGSSPMYYGGYGGYYYPSFRSVFFSRAPFARGNIRNPSPFFRSPGAPGQPPPPGARVRGGRGGAAHRR